MATVVRAQNSAPANLGGNRFLFVVDTSAPMEKHALEARQMIVDLLASSGNGQIHPGDTLGIWTFNNSVHTGELPLHVWLPGHEWEVAARMADFLQHQHYGKKGRLDEAMADIFEIVKHSDNIVIVLVSDGQGKMKGTPFDAEINAAYKKCLKEIKKSQMPVVTVLLGEAGKITKYTVNSLPWPVVVPQVPAPPRPVVVVQAPAQPSAPAPHPKILPPLILEGPSPKTPETKP